MSKLTDFQEKFKLDSLTLFTTDHWTVSVRPAQVTVGSLVLSLTRECESFADMTVEESADLKIAFEKIERMFKNSFKPDRINYLALMMVDPQVHFHVLPRYKDPLEFAGQTYTDTNWPKPADILNSIELSTQQVWEKLTAAVDD